jgi:pimeloyl-ACP methyl ester carboxylesterase
MHPNIEKGTIMNWRKQTVILLAALPVLLALAACQGEATPAPTPTAVPTVAAPTAAPTEETVAEPTAEPTAAPTEAAAAAATSAGAAAWEPVACDTLGVGPEVAAVADCGFVTVPESRTGGSDRQIKLAVVRVRTGSADPGAPIVLGTGGPGGGGLDSVLGAQGPGFLTTYGPILEDRDFVLFSQRGTALAQPALDCPAYNALTFEASTKGMSVEERGAAVRDALVACAEAFKAEGVDLAAYNTNENADDVDAIRQALGYDKIFFYGESYGTQLGQFVLRRHPDILAGIMLDGIVPVTKGNVGAGQRYSGRLPHGLRCLCSRRERATPHTRTARRCSSRPWIGWPPTRWTTRWRCPARNLST